MKKTFLTIFITCILMLVLSFSASATGSVSASAASDTSSFHVQFDLSTIDWTAISSILTAAAIGISIWSNRTAQKAIKTTIDIQRQAAGLSMMQKRVLVISAVKADNLSAIQENDVLHYFNKDCLALYKQYKSDYKKRKFASRNVENYFKDLAHQYINELDDNSDIQKAIVDIDQYQVLAMSDSDSEELNLLSQKYQLHNDYINSYGNLTHQFFTYDDICNNWQSSEKTLKQSKNDLITALEKILSQSLELPDN